MAARFILEDGWLSIFDAQARLANFDLLGHPPGYEILMAFVFSLTGESDVVIQFITIFFDVFSVALIYLIAEKSAGKKVAVGSALLAAFYPSFALNSVHFLPDTLSVFPILAAVYFLISAKEKSDLKYIILSGIGIGISCWFRSNSLFLPLFFAVAIFFIFEKDKRLIYSAAVILSAMLTIAPITIRNAIVFKEFVPISLGAGQILLEGIGDYDKEQKFGIPNSDYEICRIEAEIYNRPDYANTLFGPDGVKRDRMRVKKFFSFVGENPTWFAGIYFKRAFSMFKFERAQKVSTKVPITNLPEINDLSKSVWQQSGTNLPEQISLISEKVRVEKSDNENTIIETDDSKSADQFLIRTSDLEAFSDYVLQVDSYIKQGRVSIKIIGNQTKNLYASSIIEFDGFDEIHRRTFENTIIPFVLTENESLNIVFANENGKPANSLSEIRKLEIFNLGKSSFTWLKPLRFLINTIQKVFVEAVILPFALIGVFYLLKNKKRNELIILLLVPAYYFFVQSFLHTEYRYILALHYFVFTLASIGIIFMGRFIVGKLGFAKD